MIYEKSRLKELVSTQEQMLLWYILEEQEKQTSLLEQMVNKSDVKPELAVKEASKMGRPITRR